MATPDEVYDSMCLAAQKLIDILDNTEIPLTADQIKVILEKIEKINRAMEDYTKRFRNN